MRDKQIENDRLAHQFEKVSNDLTTHQDLIQVSEIALKFLDNFSMDTEKKCELIKRI